MSRSRRKTPIAGITTATSDKVSKVFAHRRERVATRAALSRDDEPPHHHAHGNPWCAPKDGKKWHGFRWPRLMRK